MNSTETLSAEQVMENRRKWAAELRSGAWEQCQAAYHDDGTYCCLGVLNQLFCGDPHGEGWNGAKGTAERLAGLSRPQVQEFIEANDRHGKTFAQIADMVDALPPVTEGN